jgi:hypothetical protein
MTNPVRVVSTLPPRRQFLERVARSGLAALAAVVFSLAVGMAGYHWTEGMPWIDAFVNAAMILSGMGPVGDLHTVGGKVFAGCYALYSGLALITIAAILLAPVVHRFLHRFHIELGRDRE